MDQSCLIVGCGYTGSRLAGRLRDRWQVSATARSAAAAAALRATGIAVVEADLDAALPPGSLAPAIQAGAIAYLAAAGRGHE